MQQLTILNHKDLKPLREQLLHDFGYFPEEEYAYLRSEKERIFIISKDIARIDLKKLIIDKLGLYFAEVHHSQVRLSKEGAQLLSLEAKEKKKKLQNVVELTRDETETYFQGTDLEKDLGPDSKLVLLQYGQEILGCARYKEKKILNFMPKIHYGAVIL